MRSTAKPAPRTHFRLPGMTTLEVAIIIIVMLSLITTLFIGAKAWKRGADRATCIANITAVQKSVRAYAQRHGHQPGDRVVGLRQRVLGPLESPPTCPGGGHYHYGNDRESDSIPAMGELYARCVLESSADHTPPDHRGW